MRKTGGLSWLPAAMLLVALALPAPAWALRVGDKAPNFKLPATTGKDIALSDFRGKKNVLIEFYVADFGPT